MKKFKIIFSFCLVFILVGCSFFKDKPQIDASISNNKLIFSIPSEDILILAYEINSLEDFKEDGLTYKNILKYENYDGFNKIIVENYKNKEILDNHAYYLLLTKEGAEFQSLGFCIKNNTIYIQKSSINDKEFVRECKN